MPGTSVTAYRATRTRRAQLRELVDERICVAGPYGATDDELQVELHSDSQSITPARLALERDGLIFWSGKTRKTRDGYPAMVWVGAGEPHVPRRPELDVHSGYCPACGRGRRTK